jgi:hypothetical protein
MVVINGQTAVLIAKREKEKRCKGIFSGETRLLLMLFWKVWRKSVVEGKGGRR